MRNKRSIAHDDDQITSSLAEMLKEAKSSNTPMRIANQDGWESPAYWQHVDTELRRIKRERILTRRTV